MTRDPRLQIHGLVNGNGPVRAPAPLHRFDENDREYYAYRDTIVYPFPCDDDERRRMDQFHTLIHGVALEKRLYTREVDIHRQARVLDVGHGTGIWAIQMAGANPEMEVYGIDLIDNQAIPPRPLPNLSFRDPVDFNSSNWGFPPNSFDFIRISQLSGAVSDWFRLYQTAYRYLKPEGFLEIIEIDWKPRWDGDNGFPRELELLTWWWDRMVESSKERPIAFPENTRHLLLGAGFEDPTHRPIQIPLQHPARTTKATLLRQYFLSFMCWRDDGDGGLPEAFEALSMSYFYRNLNIPPDQIRTVCSRLRDIYPSGKWPIYHNIEVWTARKPPS